MSKRKPYTKKAKYVIDEAAQVSEIMHHNYIGTEHLLLSLLREGTGVAAKVLLEAGVDEQKLIELIETLIAPSGNVMLMDRDGMSPRMTNVLEGAAAEAERFKSREIGTEHLLLSLIKEPDLFFCQTVREGSPAESISKQKPCLLFLFPAAFPVKQ